ncbi:MAG: secretin N-terminal domain-containing protein, partial [Phycisphaerae bacterium]
GVGGAGGTGTTGTDSAITRGGKVTASSDDRTNTLVVVGPAETLETIDGLVKKLDSDPIQDTSFFIYPLKNAKAQNLQSVLNGFFGNSTSGSTSGTNTNRSNNFQPLGTSSIGGFGNSGSGSSGRTGNTGSRNTSALGSTLGGNNSRNSGLASSVSGLAKANSDLVGQVYVVAEPDTNSLLITTSSKYQTRVKDMIAQLDRDVPQVLIKVLVAEVTHTDSSDIGIEYSILNKRPSGNGATGGSDMAIASAISNAVATGTPGGLVASVVESNFTMALKALATNGKLDVLSRPSILASDNQLASILVGQSVPFITSSNITSNGNVVNSVTYQDVGIILNVTPHINPDGLVIMDVAPEISQVSSQTVTIQEGVKVPVIDKRSAQSRVAIKDGQTIIIGGLMQDRVTDTVSKIPLLGDIPWLGELFKSTTKKKEKTELLIFLTPLVARQPEHLQGITTEDLNRTKLVPNAISTETFNEHIQGMQRTAEPAATQPATTQPVPPR